MDVSHGDKAKLQSNKQYNLPGNGSYRGMRVCTVIFLSQKCGARVPGL